MALGRRLSKRLILVKDQHPPRSSLLGRRHRFHTSGTWPHSFRCANIRWRRQVGGNAIEASKIAGYSDLEMTGEYTFVAPERQNELTRCIQERLADAARKDKSAASQSLGQEVLPGLAAAKPATPVVQ